MMGTTHRLAGALAGAGWAAATDQSWPMVVAAGLVASATSHGWMSPDVDQTEPWEAARGALPGSIDQVMNHRIGVSHWWGLVPLAAVVIRQMEPTAAWVWTMLLVGWASHLVGDFVFGKLALFPWGGPTFGLGLDTDGFIENRIARPLIGVAVVVVPVVIGTGLVHLLPTV